MTETAGMASSRVVSFTAAAVWMRALIPKKTTPATMTAATSSSNTTRAVRAFEGGRVGGRTTIGSLSSMDSLSSIGCEAPPVQETEHGGNEEERGNGGEDQSTDHGAPERRVLLAAFAEPHGHGNHADDHGERGHQHGTEAREPGFERGAHGVAFGFQMLLGEVDHQNTVGCRD